MHTTLLKWWKYHQFWLSSRMHKQGQLASTYLWATVIARCHWLQDAIDCKVMIHISEMSQCEKIGLKKQRAVIFIEFHYVLETMLRNVHVVKTGNQIFYENI